jgi:SNF2 family DNA or RNA helicase
LETVQTLRRGRFDLVALDEAHRIKNWRSGVSKAVRELNAGFRWAMTGTPLENRLEDVFSIFGFVKPDLFSSQTYVHNQIQSVIKPFFLRRRKEDVLLDLPSLVENPVWLRLEDEQRKSYNELEKKGVLELFGRGEALTAHSIIVLLGKLKQVCNRCPRTGESSKLAWLRDSLVNIVAENDKVLIFTQYTDDQFAGADWLERELANFGALNFSTASTDKKKKTLLEAFSQKPEHKVFIGHPRTAGLGLNELVVANYVVHFDHWWNPAVMNQATARAHRPGQKKTVFVYDLWVEDTYEEIIFELLNRKQSLYDEVIDSMSTGREPESMAFEVMARLFTKYNLEVGSRAP